MKISVIGVGYLGAVHAASMASIGHEVIGLDVDTERIRQLNAGIAPFHEPDFEPLLRAGIEAGTLRFTTDYAEIATADVHFLGLGTPQLPNGNGADLRYLEAAVSILATHLPARHGAPTLVVGKSTVPVGTARRLARTLAHLDGVRLLWNPEFLREGFAVVDTLRPDRIVYGVNTPASDPEPREDHPAVQMLDAVYAPVLAHGMPRLLMGLEAAELVKASANAFLATKISFINAIAEICEATGADVTHVARAIGMDERIGRRFLRAGVGFGGGCLPKDIRAFVASAEDLGCGSSLAFLREVDAINQRRRDRVVQWAREMLVGSEGADGVPACGGAGGADSAFDAGSARSARSADGTGGDGGNTLAGKRIAILGASFKPDSDDVRDSPALEIAERLMDAGADVCVTDPAALENARRRVPGLHTASDLATALRDADLVLLLTEWTHYRDLDPDELRPLLRHPCIIDGRGVIDPAQWRDAGWEVRALGRP